MAWFKLKFIPTDILQGKITNKNDREFVFACDTRIEEYCIYYKDLDVPDQIHIHKYNVDTNKWCKVFRYPRNLKMRVASIAMNKEGNKIYLTTDKHKLIIINTDTKIYDFHYHDDEDALYLYPRYAICNVNGKIHLIGDKHLMFDEATDQFTEISNFWDCDSVISDYCAEPLVIYVSSKQTIISFMYKEDWEEDTATAVWTFNLRTKTWHQCHTMKDRVFKIRNAVLTRNEKFVIIIDKDNKFYVMDIRDDIDYKLSECNIKPPLECPIANMVRTGGAIQDEILVHGWIKKLFKTSKFHNMQLPPNYIMKLISNWYSIQLLHIIYNPDPICKGCPQDHYAINVNDILSNAKMKNISKMFEMTSR